MIKCVEGVASKGKEEGGYWAAREDLGVTGSKSLRKVNKLA